jgi:DNA relaxase NicK
LGTYLPTVDVPLHSAGVDYCTVTSRGSERAGALEDLALRATHKLARMGVKVRPSGTLGYAGWQADTLTYGKREDGALLRLSGAAADVWWADAVHLASNVTRLDVQVTIDGGPECAELAEIHEQEAIEAARLVGRPPRIQLTREHERGQTLYLGARTSQVYRRCYDKHAEKPTEYPPGSWRYEVEYKSDVAALVGRGMLDSGEGASAIPALVWRQFARCGVTPLFDARPSSVGDRQERVIPDTERSLRWLVTHVAKTTRRLEAAGHGDLARRALFGDR